MCSTSPQRKRRPLRAIGLQRVRALWAWNPPSPLSGPLLSMYIPRVYGTMWNILFVCVENACRSQMAEAWARHLGQGRVRAWSAGSHPAKTINPYVRLVMRERGIELRGAAPKGFDVLPEMVWDAVVTMGCGEECPWIPARIHVRWEIPDPKGRSIEVFRRVRDEIEHRVRELLEMLDSAQAEEQPAL